MQILFFLVSAFFLLSAIAASFRMRFTIGLAGLYAVGILFLLSAYFYSQLSAFCKKGAGLYIKRLLQMGCALFFLLAFVIFLLGKSGSITYTEKAVIVLGAGLNGEEVSPTLRYRLDAAYEYHLQNPNAYIVVTGGQGPADAIPEAVAMQRYLVEMGVPAHLILTESASANTQENFLFSIPLLEEKGITTEDNIVYISNRFHNYRAGLYARLAGFSSSNALVASLSPILVLPCYFREVLAVLHFWLTKYLWL